MKPSFTSTDLLDSLGYGYFELDLMGRLTYGNKAFFNALGYTKEELLGKHFRRYVDRRQVSLMFNIFSMIYKTGMVEKKLPMDFVHKDGTSHTAEGSIALIRDENNNPVGYRSILLDITERKQKETTIIQAKKQAERIEIARVSSASCQRLSSTRWLGDRDIIRPARQVAAFHDVFPIMASNRSHSSWLM
jgi:PAS domain S-box-containing protein